MTVEELLDSLSTNYLAQDLYVEAWRLIHSAITAARAEGAEQERERLRSSALTSWCGRSDEYGDMLMMPASVLSPAPSELPR